MQGKAGVVESKKYHYGGTYVYKSTSSLNLVWHYKAVFCCSWMCKFSLYLMKIWLEEAGLTSILRELYSEGDDIFSPAEKRE